MKIEDEYIYKKRCREMYSLHYAMKEGEKETPVTNQTSHMNQTAHE